MEFVTGACQTADLGYEALLSGDYVGQRVSVHGAVHALRPLGGVVFLTLRLRRGAVQCVTNGQLDLSGVAEECAVRVAGTLRRDERAPGGVEIDLDSITVLSAPAEPMPVPVNKYKLKLNLDTELPLRPLVLRNLQKRSVFRIQEGLCRAFREYLTGQEFTEIHTPKIVHAGAEGGSNIFRMEYFNARAFLTQSHQFFKHLMVGV